jgi:hypothetical protein
MRRVNVVYTFIRGPRWQATYRQKSETPRSWQTPRRLCNSVAGAVTPDVTTDTDWTSTTMGSGRCLTQT